MFRTSLPPNELGGGPKGPRARAAGFVVRAAVVGLLAQAIGLAVLPIALEGGGRRPGRAWALVGAAFAGGLAAAAVAAFRNLSTLAPWRIALALLPLFTAARLISAGLLGLFFVRPPG